MHVEVTRQHDKGSITRTFACASDVVAAIGLFVEDGAEDAPMVFTIKAQSWDGLDSLQTAYTDMMTTGAFAHSSVDITDCDKAETMMSLTEFANALVYEPVPDEETVYA
jgi:hypothetical protein